MDKLFSWCTFSIKNFTLFGLFIVVINILVKILLSFNANWLIDLFFYNKIASFGIAFSLFGFIGIYLYIDNYRDAGLILPHRRTFDSNYFVYWSGKNIIRNCAIKLRAADYDVDHQFMDLNTNELDCRKVQAHNYMKYKKQNENH